MTVNSGNPFIDNNKASQVNQFHNDADTDNGPKALHHTLGEGPGQAADGFKIRQALDAIEANVVSINGLIADLTTVTNNLTTVTNNLVTQTAILDKVGKRWERLASAVTNVPNAAAAPYTALSGFNVHEGDTFAEVGLEYTGSGVFTCLEAGSYNFEVAINWAANATGRRIIFVNKNSTASGGNSYYRLTFVPVVASVELQFHKFDMQLVANDVIRFTTFQDSGGILAFSTADGIQRPSGSYCSMVGVTRILGQ